MRGAPGRAIIAGEHDRETTDALPGLTALPLPVGRHRRRADAFALESDRPDAATEPTYATEAGAGAKPSFVNAAGERADGRVDEATDRAVDPVVDRALDRRFSR